MLNQVVVVGRIAELPKENGQLLIAVPRSYKNEKGEYETDIIPCTIGGTILERTQEYCKKGDIVGIRGRIQMLENQITILAEKLTFLSTNKDLIEKD